MITKGVFKPILSIPEIGKFKFWAGIIVGILATVVFFLFFNYSRETLRSISAGNGHDLYLLPNKEFRQLDLFFAFLSTTLSLGLTQFVWFTSPRRQGTRKDYFRKLIVCNSWLYLFVILMVVSRLGSVLPIILYTIDGYDNHLNFIRDFSILLIIIPSFLFIQFWIPVRLRYRTHGWIFLSGLIVTTVSLISFKAITIDRSILNDAYFHSISQEMEHVDKEIAFLDEKGIEINEQTIDKLKKFHTESSYSLTTEVQNAFSRSSRVSLDTIIMQKIIVHNLKRKPPFYWQKGEKDKNWCYAQPEQIYHQIMMYDDPDAIEVKQLIDMLYKISSIIAFPERNFEKMDQYSSYEWKMWRMQFFYLRSTESVISRHIQVVEKLKTIPGYSDHMDRFPKINFDDLGKRQKWVEIDLNSVD